MTTETRDEIRPGQPSPTGGTMYPLNKSRKLSRYWRQISYPEGGVRGAPMVAEWVQTTLLPSDPVMKEIYLGKGFRLTPPPELTGVPEGGEVTVIEKEVEVEKVVGISKNCPACEFKAKSLGGLVKHIHNKHPELE